jgi:molecular chaperone GrpE
MAPDSKRKNRNRIPVKFLDEERNDPDSDRSDAVSEKEEGTEGLGDAAPDLIDADMAKEENEAAQIDDGDDNGDTSELPPRPLSEMQDKTTGELGGPLTAELVATRAELKRVEAENSELRDRLARRQADFENYRKRTERERGETFNRVVADIAAKLLPVLDNLKRALDAEASVEASESDEFRHFLSGVDLIYKQLNGVLEAFGVKPINVVGEQFNPHIHEAVVTEPTDEYEPDTIVQEIVTGYRLGDKLIRPALVKVAVRKENS